ncbi:MAG: DUF3054 domain-containing protein [Actinobacteria bacterium]|nr:DUF3054 domain-containing protein [Actinomycetota bacterium]
MKHRVLSLVADAALVVLFVFIGTRNHDTDKDIAGVLSTAAPFLVGLATVVIGMLLRNFAWNRGTAGAFIVVATIFNAFTLVGWRVARENFGSRRKS